MGIKLAKAIAKLVAIATIFAVPSYAGTVIAGNAYGGSGVCVHGSQVFYPAEVSSQSGVPQYFTITPGMKVCKYLNFVVVGSGGLTTGTIPISALSTDILTMIVGDGKGGSFVCLGNQCNTDTVLLSAGGNGSGYCAQIVQNCYVKTGGGNNYVYIFW
jgi:hypothetical protein